MTSHFWNEENTARLRVLASAGTPASAIASELGTTALSVTGKCGYLGIPVVKRSPAEEAEYRDQKRATERNRMRFKRARRRERAQESQKAVVPSAAPRRLERESFAFRRAPQVAQLTKSQLRAELAQAVRNTAAMPVE